MRLSLQIPYASLLPYRAEDLRSWSVHFLVLLVFWDVVIR